MIHKAREDKVPAEDGIQVDLDDWHAGILNGVIPRGVQILHPAVHN